MQPIERYGLVALLFLVVTVVAVVLWDKKSDKDKAKLAQGAPGATLVQPQPGAPELGGAQPPAATGPDLAQPTPAPALAPTQAPTQAPALAPTLGPGQAPTAGGTPTVIADPQDAFAVHAPAPAASGSTYKVKRGDTLSSIAKSALGAGSRYPEILALNPGLDPNRMRVGAELVLPGGSSVKATPASAPKTPSAAKSAAPAAGTTYTVRRNESLWSIAQAQLGDGDRYTEIAALNPQIDPKRLVVGMQLRLPATSARPTPRVADKRPAVASNTSRRGGVL
ncbi:MAG: LysM peptidoglycan-binding domain-containing protein [Planctomycetota bacterium]|nr:MAG: LysM peptidoglycan-binding domain-containing protein [Planctomycetota bacterium]